MSGSYDEVRYPGHAFSQTHPDSLSTLGQLFGMTPAPVSACRVLELGCGEGANLAPMAYQLPGSAFLGIDLANEPIQRAKKAAATLGLANLEFSCRDVMEIGEDFGRFDYIITHGLYSWVPPAVREKILEISGTLLTEQGIAYISYNACPGGLFRNVAREILLYHTRDISDPQERIREARAMLSFLAGWEFAATDYRALMSMEAKELLSRPAPSLYHDTMSRENASIWFHDFARNAARHGLQFLAESDFHRMQLPDASSPASERPRLPTQDDDVVVREQYIDILTCRWFRKTLLCRDSITLNRELRPEQLDGFLVAASLTAESGAPDLAGGVRVEFRDTLHGSLQTDYSLGKAALCELADAWPAALPFGELFDSARRRLSGGSPAGPPEKDDRESLARFLLRLFSKSMIELHTYAFRFARRPGARPRLSPVARVQLAEETSITNLRHRTIEIGDERLRNLLLLLDGARDRATLAAAIGVEERQIDTVLEQAARLAILEA